MTKFISMAGSVLVALGLWAAAGHSTTSQGAAPTHETVVYSTIQPANWDLYLFDRPGAAPRQLTISSFIASNPHA